MSTGEYPDLFWNSQFEASGRIPDRMDQGASSPLKTILQWVSAHSHVLEPEWGSGPARFSTRELPPATGNSHLENAAGRREPKPGGDLNAPQALRTAEGTRAFGWRRRFGFLACCWRMDYCSR